MQTRWKMSYTMRRAQRRDPSARAAARKSMPVCGADEQLHAPSCCVAVARATWPSTAVGLSLYTLRVSRTGGASAALKLHLRAAGHRLKSPGGLESTASSGNVGRRWWPRTEEVALRRRSDTGAAEGSNAQG